MDLFALGRSSFDAFREELASYGIPVDPRMELRRGRGLLCYYDTGDGHIYLSVPDGSSAMGRLNLMVLRTFLSCDTEEEMLRFFRQFIPRLVAHEMAHHLRHKHGRFGQNHWEEEQLANQLAVAVTRHRLTPEERAFAMAFLERALAGLSEKVGIPDAAALSYYNVLEAMNASGRINDDAVERMEVAQKVLQNLTAEQIAAHDPELVRRRNEVIRQINEHYANDYVRYMYYHAGWLYVDLTSHGAEYVDEFAHVHLGRTVPLLPVVPEGATPTNAEIHACFTASRLVASRSDLLARYFYKRYRTLLWQRLHAGYANDPERHLTRGEAQFFLENWSEGASDAMEYLSQAAPPAVRELFPARITARPPPLGDLAPRLPAETDRRLLRHVMEGEADEAAASTLSRLALLERTDVFRSVPAEPLLEICRTMWLVRLAKGETIIWEGDVNDDVFFLTKGRLEVFVREDGAEKRVGAVTEGDVFGEMAFFARDVRNATARAAEPSECFVIKDSDLLLLSFKHPSIPMQMAGALARRLAGANRRAAPLRSTYDPRASRSWALAPGGPDTVRMPEPPSKDG